MLVELTDGEGQPVWVNPSHVAKLEWAGTNAAALTLVVSQEVNSKLKAMVVQINMPARQVADMLNVGLRGTPQRPQLSAPAGPAPSPAAPPAATTSAGSAPEPSA